jgi:hypothetical protein
MGPTSQTEKEHKMPGRAEVADYIHDQAEELADMAAKAGLAFLGQLAAMMALEAQNSAARFRAPDLRRKANPRARREDAQNPRANHVRAKAA